MTRVAVLKQSCQTKGGLEKQTLAIIKALLAEKIDVDLLVQEPFSLEVSDLKGLRVRPLCCRRPGSFWSLHHFDKRVTKHLKEEKYDGSLGLERHSLQTHYRAGNGVHKFFLQERLKEASFLKQMSLRFNPFHLKVLEMEAQTFGEKGARRIYTNSNLVANQIHEIYKTPRSRLVAIHNGVQWKDFEEPFQNIFSKRETICFELGIDPKERYLGFIGHGFKRKGLDLALEWLNQSQSHFHLLIVGKDKETDSFRKKVQALNLCSRVHFLGAQKNIPQILGVIEKLILPTRYDPFANVTLESLAMGTDVWTSLSNGAFEILPSSSKAFALDSVFEWIEVIEKAWQTLPASREERILVRKSVQYLELETQIQKLISDLLSTL